MPVLAVVDVPDPLWEAGSHAAASVSSLRNPVLVLPHLVDIVRIARTMRRIAADRARILPVAVRRSLGIPKC